MRKSKFSEEQIVYALKQAELGVPVLDLCRKYGVSEQTFYRWRKKYGGLEAGELRRLRQLEEENRKLKQLVAELSLDKHVLQEVIAKKSEACTQTGACPESGGRSRDVATASMQAVRIGPEHLELSKPSR